jgi:tight adherence protein B
MVWVIVAIAMLGVGILVGGLILSRRAEQSFLEERLGITEERAVQPELATQRRTPVGDALNRALASRGVGADLATQLARADLKITVGEFMAATVILVIGAGAIAYVLRRDILITAVACLGAFFGPRIYVSMTRNRRLKAFNNQLGDTINLMVNGIRAGYSILQAMEAVSQEMGPPIADEFGRVVQEVQLGLTLEHAMNNMLRRVPSDDLDMMITGQSRMSGYMIGMVPVALAIFLYVLNPSYMSQMVDHVCGYVMLACAGIGIAVGFAVINKIMQIEV